MCVWRNNKQFFTHKASLGPIVQIVENGLIRFGKRSFNVENFQRPDWIGGSFHTTFKLARLVQIPNIHKRGELFFSFSNRPQIRCQWLCISIFFFDGNGGFLANQPLTSLFRAATTSGSLFTHAVDRWPSVRRISTAY